MRKPLTPQQPQQSRREFLRAACAGVTATALLSTIRDLRLINAAAADGLPADAPYRALVCLFLFGGNDANNFLVPTDNDPTGYPAYLAARKQLAIPQAALLPINPSIA